DRVADGAIDGVFQLEHAVCLSRVALEISKRIRCCELLAPAGRLWATRRHCSCVPAGIPYNRTNSIGLGEHSNDLAGTWRNKRSTYIPLAEARRKATGA